MKQINLISLMIRTLAFTVTILMLGCGGGGDVSPNQPSPTQSSEDPTPPTGIKTIITVNSQLLDVFEDNDPEMTVEMVSRFYYQYDEGDDVPFQLGEGNSVSFTVSTDDPDVTDGYESALEPYDIVTDGNRDLFYAITTAESDEDVPADEYRRAPVSREADDGNGGITTYQTQITISADRTQVPPEPWFPTSDTLDPDLSSYLFNAPNSIVRVPHSDEITAPASSSTWDDENTWYELTDSVTLAWEPASEDNGERMEIDSTTQCSATEIAINAPIEIGGDTGTATIPIESFLTTVRDSDGNANLPEEANCEITINIVRVAEGSLDPVFSADSIFVARTRSSNRIILVTAIPST